MIDRYGITDDMLPLLINVAPNLMTIESQKIFTDDNFDDRFIKINESMEK